MDSRIREIEQRLIKAKAGLNDGGRDDYLEQLYLLDAEIKAVIKENGMLPQAFALTPKVKKTRSLMAPALQFGMSLAVVLLSATITYAAFQAASVGPNTNQPVVEATVENIPVVETANDGLPSTIGDAPDVSPILAGPAPSQTTGGLAVSEGLVAGPVLAEVEAGPGTPKVSPGAGAAVSNTPSPSAPANTGSMQVVAINAIPPMVDTPVYKSSSASQGATGVGPGQISSGSEGFDWTIARFALPGEAKKGETAEIVVVNLLKEKLGGPAGASE